MSGPTHPTPNEDALDAALDALARGDHGPLDRLDAGTRATVDLLADWATLGGLAPAEPPAVASPGFGPGPSRRRTATGGHPTPPAVTPATAPPPGRRWPSGWSMVAWIAIVAILGAAIYGAIPRLRDRDDPAPTSPALLAAATPASTAATETAVATVNIGGSPGHAWVLGDAEPYTGNPETLIDGAGQLYSPPLVVDGTVILTVVDDQAPDGFRTFRYDIESRTKLWTAERPLLGPFASDGERVYGIMPVLGDDSAVRGPAAIDLDTGAVSFAIEAWPTAPLAAAPVVANGMTYFTDGLGNVTAIAAGETTPAWSTRPRPARESAFSEATLLTTVSAGGSLVVAGDDVYTTRPSHTVVRLDGQTGEELGAFNVVDDLGAEVELVSLQAQGDRLVVIARLSVPDRPSREALPASILVYDIETLEPVARTDVDFLQSENLVITDDAIYAAVRISPQRPVTVFRIDPATYALVGPVSEFSLDDENPVVGLSLSGDTLIVNSPGGTVAFIDVASGTLIEETTLDGMILGVFPVQLSGQAPVVVSMDSEILVFRSPPMPNNAPVD